MAQLVHTDCKTRLLTTDGIAVFRHSDFLTKQFCQQFWVPFLQNGEIKPADQPDLLPLWVRVVTWFPLRWILLLITLTGLLGLVQLTAVTIGHGLPIPSWTNSCDGLPGETAWIYAGQFDKINNKFTIEPVFVRVGGNLAPGGVKTGEWIRLSTNRRTMILDYDTSGIKRAMDSPFLLNGKITYTCKTLPPGENLYVADVKIDGPSPSENHMWLRVRLTLPGS